MEPTKIRFISKQSTSSEALILSSKENGFSFGSFELNDTNEMCLKNEDITTVFSILE